MFRLHHSTADKKRIPLACDPTVIEANATDALAAYAETHDPDAIVVPADAAMFTIRPLTAAERVNAVSAAAGKAGGASLTAYASVALPAAVEKVEQGGVAYPIRAFLDAIDDDSALIGVLAELVNAVRTISGLDSLGKAHSGPRAG
jgi:hypothetical protein